jgi:hypothetical protein
MRSCDSGTENGERGVPPVAAGHRFGSQSAKRLIFEDEIHARAETHDQKGDGLGSRIKKLALRITLRLPEFRFKLGYAVFKLNRFLSGPGRQRIRAGSLPNATRLARSSRPGCAQTGLVLPLALR